ncbi:MAG: ParB/RepB/Spo0J family partition protein [Pseudomonadota bacterium]
MAKRKRLEMPTEPVLADLETKSFPPRTRMPIAEVAGTTANQAALETVAREMTKAEEEGRIIKEVSVHAIHVHHLARDRMVIDEDEMEALMASIAERGQQTPIEVVRVDQANFGLISGLRRLEAVKRLGQKTVLAFIRTPESSEAAYRAMIEENEIRADLSFYERANIAVTTVEQGVYEDAKKAVKALFAHAPRAKRWKIRSFVILRETLGEVLSFPTAIPEKLGLALAQALTDTPGIAGTIRDALAATPPQTAAEERSILETALRRGKRAGRIDPQVLAPGLFWKAKEGQVVISGPALDERLMRDLRNWMQARTKR